MSTELVRQDKVVELTRPAAGGLALTFQDMVARIALVDQFYREVMQKDTDYGVIPGTDKPTLYQTGAQTLDTLFGLSPRFEIMPASVIDWGRPIPFFHYIVCCRLVSLKTGETVAEGVGSCNSHEDRYRWRNAKRTCPECGKDSITKGREEYGGGWLCWKKQGGCGAKFSDGDATVEGQQVGKIENEDSGSLDNTILKMSCKRAHVAATLNATGASRIFTQDIEDLPQFQAALRVDATVMTPEPATAADLVEHLEDQSGRQVAREPEAQRRPAAESREGRVRDIPRGPPPASAEDRATFEASWKRGCAQATARGVPPGDKPGPNATVAELRRATFDLKAAIDAREALNATLVERIAQAQAAGATIDAPDPAQMTEAEVQEIIAICERALEVAGLAPAGDEADTPF